MTAFIIILLITVGIIIAWIITGMIDIKHHHYWDAIYAIYILAIIILAIPLFATGLNAREKAEHEKSYKTYQEAIDAGYVLYLDGSEADPDTLAISAKNIKDFTIVVDDKEKRIKMMSKGSVGSTHVRTVYIPVHY